MKDSKVLNEQELYRVSGGSAEHTIPPKPDDFRHSWNPTPYIDPEHLPIIVD